MSSFNSYAVELPYLGVISLGKSPTTLKSFQKPLRELYILYCHEQFHAERRLIITDCDLLIFGPRIAAKNKYTFLYTGFESIIDLQILKLSMKLDNQKKQSYNSIQAGFLPIGCEHQPRFQSLYSTINKSQYNNLAITGLCHPPLLLLVIRKPGVGNSCSLLDGHVFDAKHESVAFSLSNVLRKAITKHTMSPLLPSRTALISMKDVKTRINVKQQIRYIEPTCPMSTMEPPQDDHLIMVNEQSNHLVLNVNSNDVVHSTTNDLHNPHSSSSSVINNVQQSLLFHGTSRVLPMNDDIRHMSSPCLTSKQRHFLKASSLTRDESEEIVNDLLNIVAIEQIRNQTSVQRQPAFDRIFASDEYTTMNKKRYFHNKKRLLNSTPSMNNMPYQYRVNSVFHGNLLRKPIGLTSYSDIGNYVPKFLRDNTMMRSSDSNENFFFRSTNEQLLNGFLKLDCMPKKSLDAYNDRINERQSTLCRTQDENIYALVQQLQKNQAKPVVKVCRANSNMSDRVLRMNAYRVDGDPPVFAVLKSMEEKVHDIKACHFALRSQVYQRPGKSNVSSLTSKPKRVASFTAGDMQTPVDYRRLLRHTDRGAYLYAQEQRHQQQQQQKQTPLEHTLGYYP